MLKCVKCESDKLMLHKDAWGQYADFWECLACGIFFDLNGNLKEDGAKNGIFSSSHAESKGRRCKRNSKS